MYELGKKKVEMNYIENRSKKKKLIKTFFYGCIGFGIFVSLSPMFFALMIIFFP